MRYVRAALDRFMPIGTVRRNWKAENEAEAILPGGGRIICKAWSQGRGGFQGDAIHAAWVDEEPTNEPAWNELLMRLADYRGRVLISFTPGLMGKTWVYERYCKEPHPDVAQYSIYGTDNPRGDPAHLRKILGGYTANERAARERGEWVNRDGMVYKVWTRHLHVVRSFPIPKEWKRFRGIDFGFKDPFACVWVARDPQDGQLHLYRLLYQSEKTNQQNGADINRLSTGEVIEWSVADSASAEGRSALNQQCGIATHPADKAIEDGIAVMTSYLAIGANGVPGLVVHDCCTEFIKEIEGYFWTKSGPADINNHALDALRYLLKRLNKADRMRDYVG
jgi:phage terminase large subunit-like protein